MNSGSNSQQEGSKRKRLTQACELCRRKKIKCDGEKPTCGNCNRYQIECKYTSSNKKRGPRRGYIELLEQRLNKMEQLLQKVDPAESDKQAQQSASLSPIQQTSPSLPEQQQQQQQQQSPTIITPSPRRPNIINNNNNTEAPALFTGVSSTILGTPPPSQPTVSFPSIELIEHILDLYFVNLYPCSPIFDQTIVRQDVRERKCSEFFIYSLMAACARFSDRPGINDNPAWRAGEKYAEKARELLVKSIDEPTMYNVQALTLLTIHEYGCGRGPRCWMYAGMAIRMAMELGLHEESSEKDNELNGSLEKLSEQEMRRRVFWTIFIIDQFSSAATGRPSMLLDSSCTAFLPGTICGQSEEYYTETIDGKKHLLLHVSRLRECQILGTNTLGTVTNISSKAANGDNHRPYLSSVTYVIRGANLLGKVTLYVNRKDKNSDKPPFHPDSDFSKLDKMIDELFNELPVYLQNTPANFASSTDQGGIGGKRQFILLHILLNTLIVLLHRPSLVMTDTLKSDLVQSELKDYIRNSVDKCLAAVDNVTLILKEIGNQANLMPPFVNYLVYTVATVIIGSSFSQNQEEAKRAKMSLGIYFQALLTARNHWAMADKLYFMIRDLYSLHINVLRQKNEYQEQQQQLEQQQQQQQQQLNNEQPLPFQNSFMNEKPYCEDWNLSFHCTALSTKTPETNLFSSDDIALALQFNNSFHTPDNFNNQSLSFRPLLNQTFNADSSSSSSNNNNTTTRTAIGNDGNNSNISSNNGAESNNNNKSNS